MIKCIWNGSVNIHRESFVTSLIATTQIISNQGWQIRSKISKQNKIKKCSNYEVAVLLLIFFVYIKRVEKQMIQKINFLKGSI